MATTPTPAPTRSITLRTGLNLTIAEYGDPDAEKGTGVLVLHGGAGPRSVAGFAAAMSEHAYVIVPTHPGFDGTERPEHLDSVADLATIYLDLLDTLGMTGVMVFGSSLGGWVASEMALRDNHSIVNCLVLANSGGITADPGQEPADASALSPAELGKLAFHNPQFRPDPSTMSEQQRAGAAANGRAQAVYTGQTGGDPKLRARLHRIEVPVLVVWGEHDGVIPLEYGHTFANSFPRSRFVPIPEAGHFPFIENPGAVFGAIGDFVDTEVKPDENRD